MNGPLDPKKILDIAREFQAKLARMKEELGRMRVEADAGAGMVRVVANGLGEILEVKIEPVAAEGGDVPMLEDLVKSAVNEALRRANELAAQEQAKLSGGIPMPVDLTKLGGLF